MITAQQVEIQNQKSKISELEAAILDLKEMNGIAVKYSKARQNRTKLNPGRTS